MIPSKSLIISLLFVSVHLLVHAQKAPVYTYSDQDYLDGLDLYEKEKYGAARQAFDRYLQEHQGQESEISSEASFFRAMSAVELRNNDAEYQVHQFISQYPASPHVDEAAFRLADYFYDKNNWSKTISWYSVAIVSGLERKSCRSIISKKLTPTTVNGNMPKPGPTFTRSWSANRISGPRPLIIIRTSIMNRAIMSQPSRVSGKLIRIPCFNPSRPGTFPRSCFCRRNMKRSWIMLRP